MRRCDRLYRSAVDRCEASARPSACCPMRNRKGHPPRLAGRDYSAAGAYFITFSVSQRERCLSTVDEEGELRLTRFGRIVESSWQDVAAQFPHAVLDCMVVMPDHVHAIVMLTEGGALIHQGPARSPGGALPPLMVDRRPVLGKIVRCWKARSAYTIRRAGKPDFVWQSRYYEHIIRDQTSLYRIRRYIAQNPSRASPRGRGIGP